MQTLLDIIELQARAQHMERGYPLRKIDVYVPKDGGFPVLATHWGRNAIYEALPAWATLEEAETEVLDTCWELGAWDVERWEIGPSAAADDPQGTESMVRVAIGGGPYSVGAGSKAEVKLDSDEVIVQLAGLAFEHGLVRWDALPNAYNPERRSANADSTLLDDGTRMPRGREGRHNLQPWGLVNHVTVYQLGEE